jgi:hypothetical protein
MIYLVMGPGRTGSTWLSYVLKERLGILKDPLHQSVEESMTEPGDKIFHTHNYDWTRDNNVDPQEVTLIISRRRDTFATRMSDYVTKQTEECRIYSNKPVTPFEVNMEEFMEITDSAGDWYDGIDLTAPYYKIHNVYFEDLLATDKEVTKAYEPLLKDIIGTQQGVWKCPYNYKDWVSNWEQLYDYYLSNLVKRTIMKQK